LETYFPFAQDTPLSVSLPEQKYFDSWQEAVHEEVLIPSL
jgi:hypothetical protein